MTVVRHRWRSPGLLIAAAVTAVAALGLGTLPGLATLPAEGKGRCPSFFVSPQGNDDWPGTERRPFRTVEQARDTIRDEGLNAQGTMTCDIVVNLTAGEYAVDETIAFDDRDSGADGHRVIYRSADGPGKARLTGSEKVDGWEPYADGIYRAKIDTDAPFYTLYEDGARATNARYPNRRSDTEWAPYLTSTLKDEDKMDVHSWLWSNPGEWDEDWDMSQGRITIWSGGSWSWFTDSIPLTDFNVAKNQLTLKHWTRYAMVNSRGGSRYFLENSLDFLDQAGEFHVDRAEGLLYYKPRNGDIAKADIRRPVVKTLISVAGATPDRRAENLTFEGLQLGETDFVEWYRNGWISSGDSGVEHQYPEYDRQVEMPRNRFGTITLANTRNIVLDQLHLKNTGFTGIYLLFDNDHNTISNSLLENVGADGIKIEGGYPGEGDISHDHTITNNYIWHIGELVPGDAAGVELMDTSRNEISHIVVKHSARYGISLEARPEVVDGDGYAMDNEFSYIRLEETGLDSGDMGAFYTYGVENQEPHPIRNTVQQMVITDVIPDGSMPDSGTRGVHMDAGGCGFAFSNIEVGEVTDDKYQSYQCNEVTNANWAEGFDASLMEYDKIGVLPSFPYPIPQG